MAMKGSGDMSKNSASKKPRKFNKRYTHRRNPSRHSDGVTERSLLRYADKNGSWLDRLSLLGTLLGVVLTVIGVVQITIWLTAIGRVIIDQNHVDMINQLVNQKYKSLENADQFVDQSYGSLENSNAGRPLCVIKGVNQSRFVVCEGKLLVAVDEYDETTGKLSVRRIYKDNGSTVFAIDRYEYDQNSNLYRRDRIIFQKILLVYSCAYLETTFDSTGTTLKTAFRGSCGSGVDEIPTHSYVIPISPPPITLFMPYR